MLNYEGAVAELLSDWRDMEDPPIDYDRIDIKEYALLRQAAAIENLVELIKSWIDIQLNIR